MISIDSFITLMISFKITQLYLLLLVVNTIYSFQFSHSAHLIPHPQKIAKGGEDAFFASSHLLVVADGVGGWNSKGVDPSLYSKFLCSAAEVYFNEDTYHFARHPEQLMQKAAESNRHAGSSTMSVATIEGQRLRSCHIGDCRLIVLRRYQDYRVIFQTVDQLHGFNFPFQLAQSQYGGDDPRQAICSQVVVRDGDIVILASDGITDNIFTYEIVALVNQSFLQKSLKDLPKKLTKIAAERGKKREGVSPFSLKAKEHGIKYEGGKLDDATIIVAEIQSNKPKSNEVTEL